MQALSVSDDELRLLAVAERQSRDFLPQGELLWLADCHERDLLAIGRVPRPLPSDPQERFAYLHPAFRSRRR
jgi:hypothetical protein